MCSRVEVVVFVGEVGRGKEAQAQRMLAEKEKEVFALGYGCCLVWWEGRCETAKECRLRRGKSSQERW